jgi:hypothetical protein
VVRCRRAILALAGALGAVGCDSTKPLPPAVLVTPAALTLEDGQSLKLTAKLRNPPSGSRTVKWSSSNPQVVTVDAIGTATGVSNGTANITVRMGLDTTIFTSVPVAVVGPAVASVSLTPAVATVYVGFSLRLTAQLRASDGRTIRGRSVVWTTPDASIAEVSTSGLVRGRAPGGPITLTATIEGRSATASVRVAHEAEFCPFIVPIALGQTAQGRLALGDCELSIDGSYVDVYEFTLAAPATVQIDMASTEFDAFMGLFDVTGRFLAEDDNSGGGKNSQIVRQLAAGKYRVWANTLMGSVTGAYSMAVVAR